MKEPLFLSLSEVMEIHNELLTRYGGASGVRDLGLVESATSTPQASFGGQFLHASLFDMAAAYAFHIAQNQPFVDGNKRTGLGSALVFLEMNGIKIHDPAHKLYDAMIQISKHKMSKQELAQLLEVLTRT
jgi:death on curing protein